MPNGLKQRIGIWLFFWGFFLDPNPLFYIVQFQKAILQKVGTTIVIAYSSRIQLSKGVKLPSWGNFWQTNFLLNRYGNISDSMDWIWYFSLRFRHLCQHRLSSLVVASTTLCFIFFEMKWIFLQKVMGETTEWVNITFNFFHLQFFFCEKESFKIHDF